MKRYIIFRGYFNTMGFGFDCVGEYPEDMTNDELDIEAKKIAEHLLAEAREAGVTDLADTLSLLHYEWEELTEEQYEEYFKAGELEDTFEEAL